MKREGANVNLDSTDGAIEPSNDPYDARHWTFLTNHAHLLLCLAHNQDITVRELASLIGITERSIHSILSDLSNDGYVTRQRVGRRSHYQVNMAGQLRHPLESMHTVGDLLAALSQK